MGKVPLETLRLHFKRREMVATSNCDRFPSAKGALCASLRSTCGKGQLRSTTEGEKETKEGNKKRKKDGRKEPRKEKERKTRSRQRKKSGRELYRQANTVLGFSSDFLCRCVALLQPICQPSAFSPVHSVVCSRRMLFNTSLMVDMA